MSLPSAAEVEHADWPSLQRMCESLGLNPKGRSAVVRMRVLDHVRRRTRPEGWRAGPAQLAPLLTRLGFPDLAARLWESTIQLDAPAPWVGLGEADLARRRLGEATKAFRRAAQMGDPAADLHRAEALAADRDFEGAARLCDAYLALRPVDVRALLMKAGFLARAGFADEASNVLRVATEAHPAVPSLARAWGIALLRAGHPEDAASAFQEAVRRDARDASAWINRGAALLLAGRTREAIGALREFLEFDPRRAEALNNLGVAFVHSGRAGSGVTTLERAAKQVELPRIVLNLGKAHEEARQTADATRAYAQVLRMRPEDAEALAGRKRLAAGTAKNPLAAKPSPETGPGTSPKARRTPAKKSRKRRGT
ncbi:MAG TPA: tetratricopeptide repeat protein [Thermoplasmata archaeon]